MEKGSRRTGKSVWAIAQRYTEAIMADWRALDLLEPTVWCRATDHIAAWALSNAQCRRKNVEVQRRFHPSANLTEARYRAGGIPLSVHDGALPTAYAVGLHSFRLLMGTHKIKRLRRNERSRKNGQARGPGRGDTVRILPSRRWRHWPRRGAFSVRPMPVWLSQAACVRVRRLSQLPAR